METVGKEGAETSMTASSPQGPLGLEQPPGRQRGLTGSDVLHGVPPQQQVPPASFPSDPVGGK